MGKVNIKERSAASVAQEEHTYRSVKGVWLPQFERSAATAMKGEVALTRTAGGSSLLRCDKLLSLRFNSRLLREILSQAVPYFIAPFDELGTEGG